MLMEQWQPYLDNYKPAFANFVCFQELTLGTVAPQSEGLASTLNNHISIDPSYCCKSSHEFQCPIVYMCSTSWIFFIGLCLQTSLLRPSCFWIHVSHCRLLCALVYLDVFYIHVIDNTDIPLAYMNGNRAVGGLKT